MSQHPHSTQAIWSDVPSSRRGVVLLVALLVSSMLTLLTSVGLMRSMTELSATNVSVNGAQTFLTTEAEVDWYLRLLRNDLMPDRQWNDPNVQESNPPRDLLVGTRRFGSYQAEVECLTPGKRFGALLEKGDVMQVTITGTSATGLLQRRAVVAVQLNYFWEYGVYGSGLFGSVEPGDQQLHLVKGFTDSFKSSLGAYDDLIRGTGRRNSGGLKGDVADETAPSQLPVRPGMATVIRVGGTIPGAFFQVNGKALTNPAFQRSPLQPVIAAAIGGPKLPDQRYGGSVIGGAQSLVSLEHPQPLTWSRDYCPNGPQMSELKIRASGSRVEVLVNGQPVNVGRQLGNNILEWDLAPQALCTNRMVVEGVTVKFTYNQTFYFENWQVSNATLHAKDHQPVQLALIAVGSGNPHVTRTPDLLVSGNSTVEAAIWAPQKSLCVNCREDNDPDRSVAHLLGAAVVGKFAGGYVSRTSTWQASAHIAYDEALVMFTTQMQGRAWWESDPWLPFRRRQQQGQILP